MSREINSLVEVFKQNYSWQVAADGDCISIASEEGLDAFVVVGSSQITVESIVFPVSSVKDKSKLNELILKTHHLMPLTSIGIQNFSGEDFYIAFGSLSVNSKDSVIIEEVETLFENVSEFIELYGEFVTQEVA